MAGVTSREPARRRSDARAMIAGCLVILGIAAALGGGGWVILGVILILAGISHAVIERDARRGDPSPPDGP